MENLYGDFHFTTDHCYSSEEQSSSMALPPPPLPPPSINNNLVVSSSDHAVPSTNNVFLHQDEEGLLRAKVSSHPLFPQLLHNYIDCHKVGATPEMGQLLDEIAREETIGVCQISSCYGADPELDDFMETYCNLLGKYKYELARPFEEATAFLSDMKTQLNSIICNGPALDNCVVTGSLSEKGSTTDHQKEIIIEDRKLKDNLLQRYSGYIGSLKNEFSKNKKKEKLPNEAKEILQAWWNIHFKWPYPTDADKVALAEWTGLDQKQINNWFINQRKRHWKSSKEIQAAVFDGIYGNICIGSDDITE